MSSSSALFSEEFTVCSYNCGGLSDHYDYLRAASMQKIMQERHNDEPDIMSQNENIQKLALKILFASDKRTQRAAEKEWYQKGCQHTFEHITTPPNQPQSPNTKWYKKTNETITQYDVRPVTIYDSEVLQMLVDHFKDITKNKDADTSELLRETRATMAKRIFSHQLKYDIICLQEADYLTETTFPSQFHTLFADTTHSKNGVAWNKDRFDLIETIGNIKDRAFAVKLQDRTNGKTVLVASGHITGCNPYQVEYDHKSGKADSEKGDTQLQTIIELFDNDEADFKLIGMDANVTSLHPRLALLKNAHYQIDSENFIDSTCTNPNQLLNTRIDWIALKIDENTSATITNIPVLNVGLNDLKTNISDHKPIAAKIKY